jgi:hypothetical protein
MRGEEHHLEELDRERRRAFVQARLSQRVSETEPALVGEICGGGAGRGHGDRRGAATKQRERKVRERETAARVGDRGEEWGPTRRSALARDQCEVGIWNWMRRGGEVIPIIKCQKQFPIQALLIPSLLSNFYRPSIL